MLGCRYCEESTGMDCGGHGPRITLLGPAPILAPPMPCTGAGTIATDLQGMTSFSGALPANGTCGICGQCAAVDNFQRMKVHPYSPVYR